MDATELPDHPTLSNYQALARDFVNAHGGGDPEALRRIAQHFGLDRLPTVEQLRMNVADRLRRLDKVSRIEGPNQELSLSDAQALIADSYGFENWLAFSGFLDALKTDCPISRFESAVDAVVTGDTATLEQLLHKHPELIRARSAREHGATLLHYIAANGVEDFRQKTPNNAVEIARIMLDAGAEVDADLAYGVSPSLRARYPGRIGSTTLGLAATSIHPVRAGVQIALMETLLDSGAVLDGIQGGWSFVNGCLANGRPEAAHFLAGRGARLDLESAAGLGRLDLVQSFFDNDGGLKATATRAQMESGFMWACEYGHNPVIQCLLDKGFDVSKQVGGMTGLHWALVGGRLETTRLLVERKASLEARNSYGGTALGCATWAVRNSDPAYRWPDSDTDWVAIVQTLIDAGAQVNEFDVDFPTGNEAVDELLLRHGMKPSKQ